MSNYQFELNRDGVKQIMQSAEMKAVLDETAQHIASGAEGEYKVDTITGRTRANAEVSCASAQTYYDNLKNNTLLKAMANTRRG
mgnify:FL=1